MAINFHIKYCKKCGAIVSDVDYIKNIMHEWYKIYLEDGQEGWVRADLVTIKD